MAMQLLRIREYGGHQLTERRIKVSPVLGGAGLEYREEIARTKGAS